MHWGLPKILAGVAITLVFICSGCNYPGRLDDPGDLPALTFDDSAEPANEETSSNAPGPEPDETIGSPSGMGATRANPAPTYDRYSLPGWEIQVLEVLRGADAWAVVQADNPKNPVPPDGLEYLLVQVEVKCLHFEDRCPSIGLNELYATGDQRVVYKDYSMDAPGHEIYFIDIFPAEISVGLCDFFVPEGEKNMELVFSLPGSEGFPAFSQHIALEPGASIAPFTPSGRTSSTSGERPEAPAPFGETVQAGDWDITLLESYQGAAVESFYADHQVSFRSSPEGYEYVLLKARVGYYGMGLEDATALLDIEQTVGVASRGESYSERVISAIPPLSNYSRYYPGGVQEGWLLVVVPVGETDPVLLFDPGGAPRYLKASP